MFLSYMFAPDSSRKSPRIIRKFGRPLQRRIVDPGDGERCARALHCFRTIYL
jgi:hypothetical protein